MSFWVQGSANPKRKFRFRIEISSTNWDGGPQIWYAKTCTAPAAEVSSVEHMFSDHVFNFPGRAKWSDVEMVLVDPAGSPQITDSTPHTVANFNELLTRFGYEIPKDGNLGPSYKTVSRARVTDALVNIVALDDNGAPIETWTLKNAFPIAFKYGDFDYGADDLREFSLTWKYDYAQCNLKEPGASGNDYFAT